MSDTSPSADEESNNNKYAHIHNLDTSTSTDRNLA